MQFSAGAAAVAVLAACAPLPSAGPAPTGTKVAVLKPLGTADAAPKTQRPSEPTQLAVAGVRVGNHEGFDRVVVDLAGDGDPGWFVDYTPSPASIGKPLAVSGNAYLNINIDGTVNPVELGLATTTPPIQHASDTGNVIDVVCAGTYEGRTQVVVGLRSAAPYSVQVLEDPKRLVVDIVQ